MQCDKQEQLKNYEIEMKKGKRKIEKILLH